jgi:small subunit ribosomal protein S18
MRENNQNQDFKSTHRLTDYFIQNKVNVDYKNADLLKKFLSPEGKILPARRTGLIAVNQRKITKAIKKARLLGLIPFVNEEN